MKTDSTTTSPPTTPVKLPSKDAPAEKQKVVEPKQPSTPDYKVELTTKPVIKTTAVAPKQTLQKRDAIIFIKGMDVFSSPSKSEKGYAGVGRIAESVEGSRIYGWDQKEEIIKEVMKVHPDNKVILVGHSMGGDTAVEIADALDTLENKFRTVDLLVTMDAVGASNDIIPQNVKKHLNVFGENDFFLNDGPHVARNHQKTTVSNILSAKDHVDIDDSKEVQHEVTALIREAISKEKGPA